jgi:hypothetical protein
MSLTKLSLGENNDVIYKLFPPRESLVSDDPAGDGNIEKLVYSDLSRVNIYKITHLLLVYSTVVSSFCYKTARNFSRR